MTIKDCKDFMIQWNNNFPIDRWWRTKHNVAFLSPDHRKCSFLDQLLEYQEDLLFFEMKKEEEKIEKDKYIPNIGEWMKYDEEKINEISEDDIEDFLEQVEKIESASNKQEE